MKLKSMLLLFAVLITFSSFAQTPTRVRGYVKKNGTYVAPHVKTKSNATQRDNYSSKPNYNPYTGKKGTKTPRK